MFGKWSYAYDASAAMAGLCRAPAFTTTCHACIGSPSQEKSYIVTYFFEPSKSDCKCRHIHTCVTHEASLLNDMLVFLFLFVMHVKKDSELPCR